MEKEIKKVYKLSDQALKNKREYTKRRNKEFNKVFTFQLNVERDKKVIEFLKSKKNRNKYIKDLIRSQIA